MNVTDGQKDMPFDGDIFITRSCDISRREFEENLQGLYGLEKRIRLPAWLKLLAVFSFLAVAFHILLMSVGAAKGVSFGQLFDSYPILALTALLSCAILYISLALMRKYRMVENARADSEFEKSGNDLDIMYNRLGVPKDAKSVDILACSYTVKEGKKVKAELPFDFFNADMKIFIRDNMLCLADISALYEIPLNELKAIKKIEKRISLPSWNKSESVSHKKYKEYKIHEDSSGAVYFKDYYALEITHERMCYEILFPCYEIDTFTKLTGLRYTTVTV